MKNCKTSILLNQMMKKIVQNFGKACDFRFNAHLGLAPSDETRIVHSEENMDKAIYLNQNIL